MAVETAVQVLADAVEKTNHPETLAQWEETLRGFPRELVASWRTSVLKHVADNPLHGLVPDDANDVHSRVNRDILLAYGTTLLIAVVTPEVLLLLQLGDGDILTVSDHCIVGRPLPSDQRLIANETTSMCASNAADDFRVAAISLLENAPALVMLSTDGYANSFRDDAGFCQVGSDLLKIIRSDGLEAVEANVEEWLNEASEQGSADDVTLGLFWRGNDDEGAS